MNFDHIFNGMRTLFVLSTLEGWPNYMFNFADASSDPESAPVLDNNLVTVFLFFMAFIFIGALFLLNLFIGVIFLNYKLAEKLSKNKFLTQE